MYRPYRIPVTKASPDIKLPEPRISKLVILIVKILGRLYLFLFYGVTKIVPHKDKSLFEAFERALSGKSKCIIAFRHPNGGEPQLLTWFFLFKFRRYAAKFGVRFAKRPHAVFVYGYEVVRWGGWVARFVMPNVGGMPIYHSRMDTKGMTRIYKAITDGVYPLAIAPEGQVSYTADSVPRLEPGVIRIGFNAALNMEKTNPSCPVEILPLSIHFRFGSWGKGTIELLLRYIEKFCNNSGKFPFKKTSKGQSFEERVRRCRDRILEINEERYKIKKDDSLSFKDRLEKVALAALETAERMLNLNSDGDYFSRLYKIRQICWDRIFLHNVYSLENIPQIERSVKDLAAGEAWHIARHQELADLCWYFKSEIPSEETALHNKIEYVQNLHDFANRTMGGAYSNRVSIFPRKVIIKTAPVINLTERLSRYKENKKAAIAETLSDLENAYLDNINEMNRTEQG
ncbi:MAG: acyltransferase [Treponema sp.]|nr:acyltransferase [Treponema sp.]